MIDVVWEPEFATEEQLSKERNDNYIASLVTEKAGYEQRLTGAKTIDDTPTIKSLEARIAEVNKQLAFLGETAEPRGKPVRK